MDFNINQQIQFMFLEAAKLGNAMWKKKKNEHPGSSEFGKFCIPYLSLGDIGDL